MSPVRCHFSAPLDLVEVGHQIRRPPMLTAHAQQKHGALPDRYGSIPVVAAYMGLRFGELAGLQVAAVDMLRRRLEVRTVVKEPRGQTPFLGSPKSSASARTLAMPQNVVDDLAAHLERFPPVNGLVWTTKAGALLRRGSFSRITGRLRSLWTDMVI